MIEPTQVIIRPSTDATESHDPEVAKAISFIRTHLQDKLNVHDVVRNAGLSRRQLYNRFKKVTGMTLYAYIQDRRLEQFARLLTETGLTVSEIAYAMGEHSVTNVARQFKGRYGCAPVPYRKKMGSLAPPLERRTEKNNRGRMADR